MAHKDSIIFCYRIIFPRSLTKCDLDFYKHRQLIVVSFHMYKEHFYIFCRFLDKTKVLSFTIISFLNTYSANSALILIALSIKTLQKLASHWLRCRLAQNSHHERKCVSQFPSMSADALLVRVRECCWKFYLAP